MTPNEENFCSERKDKVSMKHACLAPYPLSLQFWKGARELKRKCLSLNSENHENWIWGLEGRNSWTNQIIPILANLWRSFGQDTEAAQGSISRWVDKTTMGHLYNGILLGCKKEESFTLYNGTDGPGEHYVKWNKPGRERQTPDDFTHKWNLMNKLN